MIFPPDVWSSPLIVAVAIDWLESCWPVIVTVGVVKYPEPLVSTVVPPDAQGTTLETEPVTVPTEIKVFEDVNPVAVYPAACAPSPPPDFETPSANTKHEFLYQVVYMH